jgi:hypothetical protein
VNGVLSVAPHLPADWNEVQFSRYRVGASQVSGTLTRAKGIMRVRLSVDGKQLRTTFSPALPPGSSLISTELNGKTVTARVMASDVDVHAVIDAGSAGPFDLVLRFNDGVELLPDLVAAEPGDRSRAVRLLGTHVEPAQVTFELAGPSGKTARVRAWHGDGWRREGGDEREGKDDIVAFPASQNDFSHATITYRKP